MSTEPRSLFTYLREILSQGENDGSYNAGVIAAALDLLDETEARQRQQCDTDEWLLQEARANIVELADDLKRSYEPEKGWPPHITRAAEVVAEITDALGESKAVDE